jgi:ornithine carbamoyltransferase
MKDVLRTSDLSPADVGLVLERAQAAALDPSSVFGLLRGETVVLYFEEPSTRTRLSFETAISRLGGRAVYVRHDELQLARGESVEDTARVASLYARAWVMRAARHEDVERFARAASIYVINALSHTHHPCQSLADLFTIRQRLGKLAGVTAAWIGPGSNVANSFIEACAVAGLHLRVACPREYLPDRGVLERAAFVARQTDARIELVDDPRRAAQGAQVVYTDVWTSMADEPDVAPARRAVLEPYRVDAALMSRTNDALFMHCLPCRRGEEVTADVVDGPRSVVFDQAENRLHTATSLLDALLRRELDGAR